MDVPPPGVATCPANCPDPDVVLHLSSFFFKTFQFKYSIAMRKEPPVECLGGDLGQEGVQDYFLGDSDDWQKGGLEHVDDILLSKVPVENGHIIIDVQPSLLGLRPLFD